MATDNKKSHSECLEQNKNSWSDFVYSSPSSPHSQQQHQNEFHLDPTFTAQHMPESNSRRHSLSVGEMQLHSFDNQQHKYDLEQLLGASLPSSWSSSSSGTASTSHPHNTNNNNVDVIPHRRALSLRLDLGPTQPIDMHHRASFSTTSPTTPAFFSPSFLDALKQEDDMMFEQYHPHHSTPHPIPEEMVHDFMLNQQSQQHPQHNHHQQQQQHPLHHQHNNTSVAPTSNNTITPSIISTSDDVNHLTNYWLLNHQTPAPPAHIHRKSSTSSVSSINNTNHSPSQPTMNVVSTPSPPSTMTMVYQQQHPSIPEEEDEDMDTSLRNQSISARMLQGANNTAIMKPLIQRYLASSEDERRIMILTSRVAQKSYGTEKRFLCPPPSTILLGASWHTMANDGLSSKPSPPSLVIQISGEKTSQNGMVEWQYDGNNMESHRDIPLLSSTNNTSGVIGYCVSKHLHINDADEKRKRVEVLVKISLANNVLLGTFASKGIKVISKPSKKRQSVKNMELCIHHGTTISLFNRIRSQTVSTKYLGVSSGADNPTGTCFVARTSSWDPFVIWVVDTTRSPESQPQPLPHHPDNPHFPAPPTIAMQTSPGQTPIAIHYNQAIVLQCVTTGLVSPVMVIRKVDKGSMTMGGNRVDDLSGPTGGECGDEALGDPVSQLHKVAFQIVQDPSVAHHNKVNYNSSTLPSQHPHLMQEWQLPQLSQTVTYLACLDNVVGMHKTTTERTFVLTHPAVPPPVDSSALLSSSWSTADSFENFEFMSSVQQQQQQQANINTAATINNHANGGGGKMTRKRRVSCDVTGKPLMPPILKNNSSNRRRVNSLNDNLFYKQEQVGGAGRRSSISSDRRSSIGSDHGYHQLNSGACWTEDVSDASVWTIVGTDCASYKFWAPSTIGDLNSPFTSNTANPITPFPMLNTSYTHLVHSKQPQQQHTLHLHGQNFTRDISVWFGDVKSPHTDYKSKDSISCTVPNIQEMMDSSSAIHEDLQHKIPILFVRGDGIIYNTDMFYTF
ncbi:Recombining binding protein suppressor of hairless [Choanephora cucurbitarum]|uniref:Recombining binding protein suppressor of hairless n=1 Tax=Choanephora cucurbitarum TaxID=101091 RepID=A0A1C7NNN9_9FUNG|nr:Recombining binding protein suppressor of hairless [Choanephora cucurbitarum]